MLHIDMDAFFASVEQLTRPTLRGRPVLVGGLGGRGVVAGASYEARAYGAHSAMPMARARRLMPPTAVTVSPRKGIYGPVSRRVFSIIRDRVPVVEQLSVDEAFMEPEELQGATTDEVIAWAEDLRAQIRQETGLPSSIGAGAGKQYAKIASGLAKPNGVYVLDPERNHELLHPLPVEKLWGIGPVTAAKLHGMGVETIGDFAAMSLRDVQVSLSSKTSVALWQLAQGTDDRPVKERDVAKSVSAEYTYPEDLDSQAQLHAAVVRAGEAAYRRLVKDGRGARTITCKVRLADLSIHTRSETLPYATQNFETLMAVAHRIAFTPAEVGPVRLVGVGFSGLDSHLQEVLFPELDREIVVEDRTESPMLSDAPAGLVELEGTGALPTVRLSDSKWVPTSDVHHSEYGHGWVQGSGHGIVTVRFESRTSGPGRMITLKEDDEQLRPCSAVCSLDWPEWLASNEEAALDLPNPERESEDIDGPDIDGPAGDGTE